jgi:MurT ligase C-terminal
VDIEQLVPQLASLVISGTRAEEVSLRFKYAGARPEATQVLPGRAAALDMALTGTPPASCSTSSLGTPLCESFAASCSDAAG